MGSLLLKVYSTMLRERVFKGSSIPAASTRSVQRCSYKQWSEGQMERALKDVVTDGLSVRRAALMYNVPKSTLGDRVSGHVQAGAISGPPRYLFCMEEGELARFIFHCGTIGYARSKSEILALVQRVLDCRGIDRTVTHGWWESFQRRHPDLVLRSPAPLSLVRSKATDSEMLGRHFDLLTSHDNLLFLEEKQRLKGQKEREIETRRRVREQKKHARQMEMEKLKKGVICLSTVIIIACVNHECAL